MDDDTAAHINRIRAMRIGQSVFFPGMQLRDLSFLRKPARAAGVGIRMKFTRRDVRHQTAGVRLWREFGEYDEL
jgi:hypothetical protein